VLAAEYQTVLPDEKLIAKELERSRRKLEKRASVSQVQRQSRDLSPQKKQRDE
jgi:hypothetical protein